MSRSSARGVKPLERALDAQKSLPALAVQNAWARFAVRSVRVAECFKQLPFGAARLRARIGCDDAAQGFQRCVIARIERIARCDPAQGAVHRATFMAATAQADGRSHLAELPTEPDRDCRQIIECLRGCLPNFHRNLFVCATTMAGRQGSIPDVGTERGVRLQAMRGHDCYEIGCLPRHPVPAADRRACP